MKALPSWKLSAKTWPPNRLFKHTKLFYQITQEPLHEPPSNNLLTKIPDAGHFAILTQPRHCNPFLATFLSVSPCHSPSTSSHLHHLTPPRAPPHLLNPPTHSGVSMTSSKQNLQVAKQDRGSLMSICSRDISWGPSHAMDWKVHLRRADPVRHLRKLGF